MDDLFKWYRQQMVSKMTFTEDGKKQKKNEKAQLNVIKSHSKSFKELMSSVSIEHTDKPMTKDRNDYELGLWNPYSIISCFILYLYSMEFGEPNLYAELNRAARENDQSLLSTLGPFACALGQITFWAERYRMENDVIKRGNMYEPGVSQNLAGVFLLFRGSQMSPKQFEEYQDNVLERIQVPGNFSCSQNLKVALGFACGKQETNLKSVVFVIAVRN